MSQQYRVNVSAPMFKKKITNNHINQVPFKDSNRVVDILGLVDINISSVFLAYFQVYFHRLGLG